MGREMDSGHREKEIMQEIMSQAAGTVRANRVSGGQ